MSEILRDFSLSTIGLAIDANKIAHKSFISTYPGGTYASASGTSFSSPLVAGTASLLLSAKSSLNQKQAASALSHAIRLTPDLHYGRLDVYQAVSAWVNNSGSPPPSGSGSCFLLCL